MPGWQRPAEGGAHFKIAEPLAAIWSRTAHGMPLDRRSRVCGVTPDPERADAFVAPAARELDAPKPGNVHQLRRGHRMEAAISPQRRRRARRHRPHGAASGPACAARSRRRLAAVGQNTNLGIVLLCAPLAAAARRTGAAICARRSKLLDRSRPRGRGGRLRGDRPRQSRRPWRRRASRCAQGAETTLAARRWRGRGARPDRLSICDGLRRCFRASASRRWRRRPAGLAAPGERLRLSRLPRRNSRTAMSRASTAPTPPEALRTAAAMFATALCHARSGDALRRSARFRPPLEGRGVNPGTSADLTVATCSPIVLTRILPSRSNNG